MKISSISKAECDCGWTGTLAFFASENWQAPCPTCGKPVEPRRHQNTVTDGNRRFSGEAAVSVTEGFHPGEVNLARKLMPSSAALIKDDGRVVFKDSKSVQRYHRELASAKRRLGVPTGGPF